MARNKENNMRLALFRQLSPAEQKKEVKKVLKSIAKTQKMLEKNGTFTFYNPKENGGLVMEYIPYTPINIIKSNQK